MASSSKRAGKGKRKVSGGTNSDDPTATFIFPSPDSQHDFLSNFIKRDLIPPRVEDIGEALNLPTTGMDFHTPPIELQEFTEHEVLDIIGMNNPSFSTNQRPLIKGINPDYRYLLYTISHILKPRKFNHAVLLRDDMFIIWIIHHLKSISWARFFCLCLVEMRQKGALGFVLPIMRLLRLQKVDFSADIKIERTFRWTITAMTFSRSKTTEDEPQREEEEEEVVRPRLLPPPSIHDVMLAVSDLRSHMDTRFEELRSHVDARLDGMRDDVYGLYDQMGFPRPDRP